MIYRECQTKFVTFTVLIGILLLFASCGQSLESHLERGEDFLKQRKYEAAVMQFRAAVDIDESSSEAQWGLARSYEKQEKFLETIEALRRSVDLAPANLEAKAKLGNYYLLFDPPQIEEAEKLLTEIFKQEKDHIEGHILRASIFSAQNKSESEIVSVLKKAISLDKKRAESYLALSRFYMKANKADEAEETIKAAIEASPERSIGYVEYGRFLVYSERLEDAAGQFEKAVSVDPKDIDAGLALGSFYVTTRENEKAEEKFKNLVAVQKDSLESRMDLGNFYNLIGRGGDAINTFKAILKESPDYAKARYALGEVYLARNEYKKVTAEVDQLLSANDQDAEALMLRARLKIEENKPGDAAKDLEEILKKQPSSQGGLFYMSLARLEMGQVDQARAFIGDLEKYHPTFRKAALLKIQASFAVGEPESVVREANTLITRTSRTFPANAFRAQETQQLRINAITSRGLANLMLGKLDESERDLDEVLKLTPGTANPHINLAKVFFAKRDFGRARDLYAKALELDNQSFDALSGLVAVLNRAGEFGEATSKIDAVMKKATGDKSLTAALYFLKSETFVASNSAQDAEAALKKSIETDENYLPAYSAYAALLISQNKTEQALSQYQTVLEKKPSASVHTLIGVLEDGRGKFEDAEKNYRKALEMSPGSPIASNNLAWIIADTGNGNLDEAMRLAQDVTKAHPRVASYFDTLGWVYHKKGFKEQAVAQFRQAVSLDAVGAQREGKAQNPGYRLRLGIALHSAGEKAEAKREIVTALSAGKTQFSSKELISAKRILEDS
jgi:tetratricopeptide (TPR) repeat protein